MLLTLGRGSGPAREAVCPDVLQCQRMGLRSSFPQLFLQVPCAAHALLPQYQASPRVWEKRISPQEHHPFFPTSEVLRAPDSEGLLYRKLTSDPGCVTRGQLSGVLPALPCTSGASRAARILHAAHPGVVFWEPHSSPCKSRRGGEDAGSKGLRPCLCSFPLDHTVSWGAGFSLLRALTPHSSGTE